MLEDIIIVVWLFLPAGFSNMAASMSRHLKFLDFLAIPVDMGLTIKGERVLGKNKTVRGFLAGTLLSMLIAYLQMVVYKSLDLADKLDFEFNYEDFNVLIFGALIGFGALFGDSVESFFKRRIGVKPGEPWFPFDQTDYILGSILFSLIYVTFELHQYLEYLIIYFFCHLIVKYVGFLIGVEDKKI